MARKEGRKEGKGKPGYFRECAGGSWYFHVGRFVLIVRCCSNLVCLFAVISCEWPGDVAE